MAHILLTMPQPGETITEGLIVNWIAKPGDDVAEGAPLVELETEKAVFEYESPFAGKIVRRIEENGARVKVGEPIAVFDVTPEKASHYLMLGVAKPADGQEMPVPDTSKIVRLSETAKSAASEASPLTQRSASNTEAEVIKMSPYVKKRVIEGGIPQEMVAELAAANPEGRLTKDMVEDYLAGREVKGKPQAKQPNADTTVMPVSAVRMRIAENMVLSKSKIPHAHTGLSVDLSHVVKFREQHKIAFQKQHGAHLNYLSLIFPALVAAIKKHPVVNASYIDKGSKSEIHIFNKIHLGLAVGTEHGLVIPVIRDLESKDFNALNAEINDKVKRAMNKKLRPDEVGGATFIFNNYGFFGTSSGVQVIQYPLSCTLGMGVIEKRVVPAGDGIAVHEMCDFTLAFDHRTLDGRDAGLFLSALKAGIETMAFPF